MTPESLLCRGCKLTCCAVFRPAFRFGFKPRCGPHTGHSEKRHCERNQQQYRGPESTDRSAGCGRRLHRHQPLVELERTALSVALPELPSRQRSLGVVAFTKPSLHIRNCAAESREGCCDVCDTGNAAAGLLSTPPRRRKKVVASRTQADYRGAVSLTADARFLTWRRAEHRRVPGKRAGGRNLRRVAHGRQRRSRNQVRNPLFG